ncbi:PilZ domain-containing protein [Marinobacter bohaiensis]|uniref:PilZ domain-containing protein n=1 Tax=Marinobacter bohaiensis TaxID=2201898 RepID=UPI0013A6D324|nr:PilZ domain-containing protein [Marinobacter bohaiensis]
MESTGWQGRDRRRFYRVDDRVALRYVRLSDEASLSGEMQDLSLRTRLADLDLALDEAMGRFAEQSPAGQTVADLLNRKLELALEAAGVGRQANGDPSLITRDISLSVGGFAFATEERIAVGENLLIDLLFYPERRTVRALARVVASEPAASGQLLRLDVARMGDADREILMGHIMRLQSERIRARSGPEDPPAES